ncbi:MAG: DUF481 domain-containing protein [Elusimicrobia bacterium]|nr:DUF481 domain-containing protein [Elusimicrobiota bacterium]
MKMNILCAVLLVCVAGTAAAGDWKISGIIGANYSETAVSDNWTAGETDARSWMLMGDGAAERDGELTDWLNTLKAEYGKASLSGSGEQENADLIYMNSIYKYKLTPSINPYAALNADSQFTEFFDPSVLTESAGLGWNILVKDDQNLNTRMGIAFKQTMLSGAETGSETGAESITAYDLKLREYAKFVSEFKVFTAFDAGADVRWDSSLYVKLGKYLTAQVGYLVIHEYDADMPRPELPEDIQTRLTFGLGLSYNLF